MCMYECIFGLDRVGAARSRPVIFFFLLLPPTTEKKNASDQNGDETTLFFAMVRTWALA